MTERILNTGFRLYVIALGLLGGWTVLTLLTEVTLTSAVLGTSWLALAGVGAVLTLGLITTREEVFTITNRQRQAFETNPLTGMPLSLYIAVLVGWTVVSAVWWASGIAGLNVTMVAYGWFAIAGVGTLLTGGLCLNHWRPHRFLSGSSTRGKR